MATKTAKTATAAAGVVDNDQFIVDPVKGIAFDFDIKTINLNFDIQYEERFVRDPNTDKEIAYPSKIGQFRDSAYVNLADEQALNKLLEEKPYLLDVLPHFTALVSKAYESFNDPAAAEARRQKKNEA